MKKNICLFTTAMLFIGACAQSGTTSKGGGQPGQVQTNLFVEPDMEAQQGIDDYEDVVLTAEDNQLIVPGAEFGSAVPVKKKGKKSNLKNPAYWPYSEQVILQMEGLEWGMSVKKVFSIFEEKIREQFQTRMDAEQGDLLAEDKIRSDMHKTLNKVKNSYTEFNGTTTGYESHMVDQEFTHNNRESMLIWDADTYVEYLFFFNNRFWKRVRLFRIDKLGGIDLYTFTDTLTDQFGIPGHEIMDDEGNVEKIVWRDDDTFVAALDGSEFFGVYGLRLSSAITETHLDKLRTRPDLSKGTVSSDILQTVDKAVTSVDMDDHNESVVDSYTEKEHDSVFD